MVSIHLLCAFLPGAASLPVDILFFISNKTLRDSLMRLPVMFHFRQGSVSTNDPVGIRLLC